MLIITTLIILVVLLTYIALIIKEKNNEKLQKAIYEDEKDLIDYHEKHLNELTKECNNDRKKAKALIRNELNKNHKLSVKDATLKAIENVIIERFKND